MGRELFLDFFTEHEVPVIRKRRHTFLKMDDENVYILKEGVVKVSVLMRDGREFNIAYLKGFDILSMFKDAVVDCKFSSLMIRVESDEASFYCVSKELFNQLLNEHSELVEYVNMYYRKKIIGNNFKTRINDDEWQEWCCMCIYILFGYNVWKRSA